MRDHFLIKIRIHSKVFIYDLFYILIAFFKFFVVYIYKLKTCEKYLITGIYSIKFTFITHLLESLIIKKNILGKKCTTTYF